MNRDELIMEWQEAERDLRAARLREKELRDEIIMTQFDSSKVEGTQTIPLGNGYKLQAIKKVNYRLSASGLQGALDELIATGDEGAFEAGRLVKYRPELSVSVYKKLAPAHRDIIDAVVSAGPGSPSLKLVEPTP